jgi:hypothetical protein
MEEATVADFLLFPCSEEALRRRKIGGVQPATTMSIWSEEECRNFENGLRNFGKCFHEIQASKVSLLCLSCPPPYSLPLQSTGQNPLCRRSRSILLSLEEDRATRRFRQQGSSGEEKVQSQSVCHRLHGQISGGIRQWRHQPRSKRLTQRQQFQLAAAGRLEASNQKRLVGEQQRETGAGERRNQNRMIETRKHDDEEEKRAGKYKRKLNV